MKKTLLSAALLTAVGCNAFAAGFEWPANFDDFTGWTDNVTTDIGADQKIKLTATEADTNKYPNIVDISTGTLTNNGQLMVQGHVETDNTYHMSAIAASGTAIAKNAGTIYVDGERISGGTSFFDITKGMIAYNGGSIENTKDGVIYVNAGAGMADQRDGEAKTAKIINNGAIYADSSSSIGINYGAFSESTVENNGIIAATNGATAVQVSEAWKSGSNVSTSGKTFKNTGTITADDGYAIYALGAKDFTLELVGETSQIDGKVYLSSTSTIDADTVNDDFELSASKLKAINLNNSALGFPVRKKRQPSANCRPIQRAPSPCWMVASLRSKKSPLRMNRLLQISFSVRLLRMALPLRRTTPSKRMSATSTRTLIT